MNSVAMKIIIIGLFCLDLWPSMFISASTPLTTFDLCGVSEITAENVSLSLNFTTERAQKTGGECALVIILKSKRVKLTVEELTIVSGAVFEIQEGPGINDGEKLGPKDASQSPSFYVTSGNAMFIRFKDVSQGTNGPSIFRGKISSVPFQDTCRCREVTNGKLECYETTQERKCELKCNPSFMELTIKKEVLTCDFKNGTWDINIHSGPLECEKVQKPLQIKATVNFNYANLTCQQVDLKKVESVIRAVLGNNSDVRSKGVCFDQSAANNPDCKQAVQVNCTISGSQAEITITILDYIVEPPTLEEANSKLQELHTAYINLKLKDVLDIEALVMKKGNESFTISKESIVNTATPWCNGENDYIKIPGNATYSVCSACPRHHLYNVTTRTCQKCPSGSTAVKGARSCTQKNGTSPATPLGETCDNKCMKGKRLDMKYGMCEWCPRNKYQNSSTKINPECIPCPGDKLTIFPGAQEVSDCLDPCLSGTFMNASSGSCMDCPIGTYMDTDKHASTRCMRCEMGKTTRSVGSKVVSDCYHCLPGEFYNSTVTMCTSCPMGKYQDEVNKDSCKDCASGTTTLEMSSKTISDCVKVCGLGKFLNDSNCFDCPKNTYQDMKEHRDTECNPCGPNKITNATGQSDVSSCFVSCEEGWFLDKSVSQCKKCPVGQYQDQSGQDHCIQCPDGKSTASEGQKNMSSCTIVFCGKGQYLNDSNCFDCPKNTYQDMKEHRDTECNPCGPNKITNATGQSDVSSCFVSCEEGWFLDKSVSQCKKCPVGQYQDQSGQDHCKQCPDGKSTASEGQKNMSSCTVVFCGKGQYLNDSNCFDCPKNTYQDVKEHNATECKPCGPNKIANAIGQSDVSSCFASCEEGWFLDKSVSQCKKCPQGQYQDQLGQDHCKQCPDGKSTTSEGAEDSRECITSDGKGSAEVVKMSVKFTSLSWSEELTDTKSAKYYETKTKIEDAIKFELHKDPSFEGVAVTALTKGSVVAEFELYFNDKVDYVPGKALQVAARNGKVGNLSVNSDSLSILQQDCSQPLGMESGKIKNEQIMASTFLKHYEPYEGRLNLKGGRGWYAAYNRMTEYLQIDFKRAINITAVATQGKSNVKGTLDVYVKEYKLSLSDNGKNWKEYTENDATKVSNI